MKRSGIDVPLPRMVRLAVELTPEEHERLMSLLGMAANDPNDDDHIVLESIRVKFSKPNNATRINEEATR